MTETRVNHEIRAGRHRTVAVATEVAPKLKGRHRIPRHESTRALTTGAIALTGNGGLTSALGVVFWLLATHLFPPSEVGRGSSLVAALMSVSAFAQLNYSRSLSGLLPRATVRPVRLLTRVYLVTCGVSVCAGAAFAILAPHLSRGYSYIGGSVVFVAVFALATVVWTIFTLEDTVLATVRRAAIVPIENGAFGILKVAMLIALAALGIHSMTIFTSWVAPLPLIVIPINIYLFRQAVPNAVIALSGPPPVASFVRYDYAGSLAWLMSTLPLPVLVTGFLGPTAGAAFYVPFTIATSVDLIALNVGNTLTAEIARADGVLTPQAAQFLRRVLLAVAAVAILGFACSPWILALFGGHYRAASTWVLRLLMLAVLPRTAMFLGVATARGQARGPLIVVIQTVAALGTLGVGLPLIMISGPFGLALAWLAASVAAASVVAFRIRLRFTFRWI